MTKHSPWIESQDMSLLSPEFGEKLKELISYCGKLKMDVRVGSGLRGPGAQGKRWARSRSPEEINSAKKIMGRAAPRLSQFINIQDGLSHDTVYSIPGQSWHNWGEAADLYTWVNGRTIWGGSPSHLIDEACKNVGLAFGGNLFYHKKPWHVQLRKAETPLLVREICETWSDIEAAMLERFEID